MSHWQPPELFGSYLCVGGEEEEEKKDEFKELCQSTEMSLWGNGKLY